MKKVFILFVVGVIVGLSLGLALMKKELRTQEIYYVNQLQTLECSYNKGDCD